MNTRKRQPVENTKTYRDALGLLKFLKRATTRKAKIPVSEIYKACKENEWSHSLLSTILKEKRLFFRDGSDVYRDGAMLEEIIPSHAKYYANEHIVAQMIRNRIKKEANKGAKGDTSTEVPEGIKPKGVIPPKEIPVMIDLFNQPSAPVLDNSLSEAIELLKKNGYKVYKVVSKEEEV